MKKQSERDLIEKELMSYFGYKGNKWLEVMFSAGVGEDAFMITWSIFVYAIEKLVSEQKKALLSKLKEEVEGMKEKDTNPELRRNPLTKHIFWFNDGYTNAIKDVLSLLNRG